MLIERIYISRRRPLEHYKTQEK